MGHIRRNFNLLEWAMYLLEQENRGRKERQNSQPAEVEHLEGCAGISLEVLVEKARHKDRAVRLNAAKCLGKIGDPAASEVLVGLLQDEDHSVRWAAMNSLILMQREAVRPLLEALTRDFQSARLREGVHHVLGTLNNYGSLTAVEVEVFHALEGSAPGIQAAWAANRVLINHD